MSLELSPSPVPIQPPAPVKAAPAPTPANEGSNSNPFASLLAGLNAAQQPQSSDMSDNPMQNSAPATAATLDPTVDALKMFMGPAFNSRLTLAQTDDITKSVPNTPPINSTAPVPADAAVSLLALLAAKTNTPTAPAADVAAPAETDINQLATQTPDSAALPTVQVAIAAQTKPHDEPEAIEASEAIELSDSAPVTAAVPTLPILLQATQPIETESGTSDLETGASSETLISGEPISLFDKLNQSPRDVTETKADVAVEQPPIETTDAAAPLQFSAPEAPKPDFNLASVTQAASPQPVSAEPNTQATAKMPEITLRPLNEAQMVEGVSVLMTRATKNQVNEFIIRMDPPELGRIDVQMKMHEDGTVQAVIASDNPNTHDLLRREASTIERALNESGFRTGNDGLSFNLKQQNSEQQQRSASANAAGSYNGNTLSDDAIPVSVVAPLRQRYENARVNITA
jgi:flagellar hook-length control protein FliK